MHLFDGPVKGYLLRDCDGRKREKKKASFWFDTNPWPIDHEECTLPLCCTQKIKTSSGEMVKVFVRRSWPTCQHFSNVCLGLKAPYERKTSCYFSHHWLQVIVTTMMVLVSTWPLRGTFKSTAVWVSFVWSELWKTNCALGLIPDSYQTTTWQWLICRASFKTVKKLVLCVFINLNVSRFY